MGIKLAGKPISDYDLISITPGRLKELRAMPDDKFKAALTELKRDPIQKNIRINVEAIRT